MNNNNLPFNFEEINLVKEFSLVTKITVLVLAIFFTIIPLYEISPEIFHTPIPCFGTSCYGAH